jgi:hypothetical protein
MVPTWARRATTVRTRAKETAMNPHERDAYAICIWLQLAIFALVLFGLFMG